MMNDTLYGKCIAFATIFLFISASAIIPNVTGDSTRLSEGKKNRKDPFLLVRLNEVKIESPLHAFQKTVYVDDDNREGPWDGTQEHPYQFIQDGINAANDGDTVFVYNGTYYENVVVNKRVNLIGEYRDATIIDSKRHGNVLSIFADSVLVNSFTIQNSGTDWHDSGIDIRSDCINIKNCIARNNYHGMTLQSSYSIISKNIITDNDGSGIYLKNSNYNIIEENRIHSNKFSDGIRVIKSSNNKITNNLITVRSQGIVLFESSKNNVIANTITKCWIGIEVRSEWGGSQSKDNIICKNIISSNEDGICISNVHNITIVDNILSNNIMFGIELSETTGNNVVNNTFINNGLYIRWYKGDSHKNSIFNNTVNGKPLIYLQDESDLIVDDDAGQIILVTCSNITIKNQNISNATTGILLCNTHDSKILNSTTVSNSWCGIELHGSTRNTISSTTISKNYEGIYIYHSNYNMITNNLIYLNKNSGIELVGSFNTISLNNISNQGYEREVHWVGGDGINVRGARNVVRENIISNNRWGIFVGIWGSDENEIIRNVISKNEIGVVLLECEKNFVSQNNFIENLRHARFENFLLIALFSEIILEYGNLWSRNYWDDFKAVIGPKIINGKFEIMIEKGGPWGDIILHKWLRWINFDWHPAKRPYKIP